MSSFSKAAEIICRLELGTGRALDDIAYKSDEIKLARGIASLIHVYEVITIAAATHVPLSLLRQCN